MNSTKGKNTKSTHKSQLQYLHVQKCHWNPLFCIIYANKVASVDCQLYFYLLTMNKPKEN